eukprot:4818471-Pyramimonas_sp.AAC.1
MTAPEQSAITQNAARQPRKLHTHTHTHTPSTKYDPTNVSIIDVPNQPKTSGGAHRNPQHTPIDAPLLSLKGSAVWRKTKNPRPEVTC